MSKSYCNHCNHNHHQATSYDPNSDRIFIHGGFNLNEALNDLWTYSFKVMIMIMMIMIMVMIMINAALNDLSTFSFKDNLWTPLRTRGGGGGGQTEQR